jgi:hypothetical protein
MLLAAWQPKREKTLLTAAMRLGYFKLLMCSPPRACNARPRLQKKEEHGPSTGRKIFRPFSFSSALSFRLFH